MKKKAEIINYRPSHGCSTYDVLCVCRAYNIFYAWSWAGHGLAKCHRCKSWISWHTLEVKNENKKDG